MNDVETILPSKITSIYQEKFKKKKGMKTKCYALIDARINCRNESSSVHCTSLSFYQ